MKKDIPRALFSFPINYTHFIEVECIGKKKEMFMKFLSGSNPMAFFKLSGRSTIIWWIDQWGQTIHLVEAPQNLLFSGRRFFFFPLNYLNNCFNSSVQFACLDRKLHWIRLGRTMIFETAFFFFWNCILHSISYYLPYATSLSESEAFRKSRNLVTF